MKVKTLSMINSRHRAMLSQLSNLTFLFFFLKGLLWLGITGWLFYMGSGTG